MQFKVGDKVRIKLDAPPLDSSGHLLEEYDYLTLKDYLLNKESVTEEELSQDEYTIIKIYSKRDGNYPYPYKLSGIETCLFGEFDLELIFDTNKEFKLKEGVV